jgi:hypothetical protein
VNADDALCLQMSKVAALPPRVLVSAMIDNPTVLNHCRAGGHAVFIKSHEGVDWICLGKGTKTELLMPIDNIAVNAYRNLPRTVQNAMSAIAIAWAQGVNVMHICHAMSCFKQKTLR